MSFNHPNITRTLEYIDTYSMTFIVQEYSNGGTLKVNMREPDQLQYIMYQIARGMEYLHSHNFVHRDLKPDNIMLNYLSRTDYLIKIADFGTLKLYESVFKYGGWHSLLYGSGNWEKTKV